MALIVLRHTAPDVAPGLCYGRLDVPLAADFETESTRIGAALPPVSTILASPLSRARRLAEAIGQARQLPVTVDPRLTEMDFGAWEGHNWSDLPRAEIDAWASDLMGARPHGGESVAMVAARVAAVLSEAPNGALIVAHAGVAKAALAWAGAPDPWDARLSFGDWISLSRP